MSLLTSVATSANRTVVAASATLVLGLAPYEARKGYIIFNTSANALHIVLGEAVGSYTDYSIEVAGGSLYESSVDFVGSINLIWSAADTGKAVITEFS